MTSLNNAWSAASEEMYKATQGAADGGAAEQQPSGDAGASSQNGNVTDVDFEEVKEDKK